MKADVLIVDDSAVARMILKNCLGDPGLAIVEADSGETALELLSAGLEPGFICLDLTMPGIGGTETLRRIKEAGYPFPVVVVTADMQRRTVEEVRSLGAADVLGKPVDPARLKALAAIYAEVGA